MKYFYATCIGWKGDTDDLCDMIDSGKEISKTEFFSKCEETDPILLQTMRDYPNDYRYYKGTGKYKNIYWYTWSCIEHFYK